MTTAAQRFYQISFSLTIFSLLGFMTSRSAAAASVTYTVTDLGELSSNYTNPSINNAGQVVGELYIPGDSGYHAFRTAANSKINPVTDNLGTFGDNYSSATGINDSGQVVGYSYPKDNSYYQAFRTAANSKINPATDDLGTLGGDSSNATGINNAGQVVGDSSLTDGFGDHHAFRTAANSKINPATDDLGTLGSSYSFANGINDSGQVVGYSSLTDGSADHAFRTAANSKINPATDDLGTRGGDSSNATGINNAGQVVGDFSFGDFADHAFRTAANSKINPATDDLGTLGGSYSAATGINNAGQVVGDSSLTDNSELVIHAFLYSNGTLNDLKNLVAPNSLDGFYSLETAASINDSGQIVGEGILLNGQHHDFLATPQAVPEPSSALGALTFGVFGVGMVMKRRLKTHKSITSG